jgi:hypothetical protein
MRVSELIELLKDLQIEQAIRKGGVSKAMDQAELELEDDDVDKTFKHKIGYMNWLALSLESLVNKHHSDLTNEEKDEWCVVADGLTEEWVMDHINCRCSLNEMIKYSLEDLEKIVDSKITFLLEFGRKLNAYSSVTATVEEENKGGE